MLPPLVFGVCLTAGAVLQRRRAKRRNGDAGTAVRENPTDSSNANPDVHHRDLQKLLDVAFTNPRLLLTARWQARIQSVARRINQTSGSVPWQLKYVYRQMEAIVDTMTYDELRNLLTERSKTPAISSQEIKGLETRVHGSERHDDDSAPDEKRGDQASCSICLQDYVEGEKLMILPTCNHVFHAKCITRWLRSRGLCPICQLEVKEHLKASSKKSTSKRCHGHCH